MSIQQFPQGHEYELLLILNNKGIRAIKKYIEPLVDMALNRFKLTRTEYLKLKKDILSDLPVALKRYKENKSYNCKFSVYFTWYIKERIGEGFEKK